VGDVPTAVEVAVGLPLRPFEMAVGLLPPFRTAVRGYFCHVEYDYLFS
jgi:hypothetical protein